MKAALPQDIYAYLVGVDLIDPDAALDVTPLTGGIASEIWRVTSGARVFCVKKALAELNVTDVWQASVERNAYEVAWFDVVAGIVPQAIPTVLAHDSDSGCFAMDYLPPEEYPVWKNQLKDGVVDMSVAKSIAKTLVTIHAATSNDIEIEKRFSSDAIFDEMRIDPYLITTTAKHPDVAEQILELAKITQSTKLALVHGDISPKNILCGAKGAVILDAEAAWYGDPAFDLAFLLNHMLLKCLWVPSHSGGFLALFDTIVETYRSGITWEDKNVFEQRVARLLPALMLARVDGKSPVEYITDEREKDIIRDFSKNLLLTPTDDLYQIRLAWEQAIQW